MINNKIQVVLQDEKRKYYLSFDVDRDHDVTVSDAWLKGGRLAEILENGHIDRIEDLPIYNGVNFEGTNTVTERQVQSIRDEIEREAKIAEYLND